jgi:DNA repair protein SbcD/Mre11
VKLIHTADWHLGRLFFGLHLTADQEHVLAQFVDLVADVRPHAVLLAGDVYDRAVPPPEAVALLGDVLERVVLGLGVPVVMIAGNHDSPDRLGFAAALLRERGLVVAGPLGRQPASLAIQDEHGPVVVHALPFAEPAVARAVYDDATLHDQAAAVGRGVQAARAATPAGARSVLVTHAFVAGGLQSESERPITVGGTGAVPADLFSSFDYVALGHLHRPQALSASAASGDGTASAVSDGEGAPAAAVPASETLSTADGARAAGSEATAAPPRRRLRYSGSLLKYSFDETAQRKSVSVIEIGAAAAEPDGLATLRVEEVPLTPRHDVRRIDGLLKDLLAGAAGDDARHDYVEAVLRDAGALYDAMGRLRSGYPNALNICLPELLAEGSQQRRRPDPRKVNDLELFAAFMEHVGGRPPSDQESAVFVEVADALQMKQRESAAEGWQG